MKVLSCVTLLLVSAGAARGFAIEYELSPNPNPGSNTITILSGEVASNNAETFENFGAIIVQSGGTLRNVTEMDILFDEDGGTGGISTISIHAGGLLEVLEGSKMNFDSVSNFNLSGTLNNHGDISSDWSLQFAVGSVANNFGILTNKKGATLRGEFNNTGTVANIIGVFSDSGGFFQQIGQFNNLAGATLTNQGEFLNFSTITNHGTILNAAPFNGGGIGRGIFRTLFTSVIDNEAGGTITNRHRWFNNGTINNAGLFVNALSGLGMSNQSEGAIHNLAGGTFQNDRVINSTSTITNAGLFLVGDIGGTGTYTQTAGETRMTDQLQASQISFSGGMLTGDGTLMGTTTLGQNATVSPGQSVGRLDFDGDLALDGTFIAELSAPNQRDQVAVTGALDLGLTSALEVLLLDGFAPQAGDRFNILDWATVDGTFGSVLLPTLDTDLGWNLQALYTAGKLRVELAGDLTGDGFVGVEDLDVVLAHWGDSVARLNYAQGDASGDGLVNQTDLDVVLNHWGNGTAPGGNIPEPGALASLGVLLLCSARRRR